MDNRIQKKIGTGMGFVIGRNGGSSRHKQNPTGRKHVRMQRKEFHIRTKQKQVCLGSNVTRMTRDRTGWKKDCSGLIDTCQKGVIMGSMQTDWKIDRAVQMLLLVCDEVFLSFLKVSKVFAIANVLGTIFRIDLAIGRGGLTFANISKLQYT